MKVNWKCVTETENWKPLIKRVNSALFPKVMHVSIPKRTIGTLWFHFLLEVFALFYRKFCRKILRTFTESFKFLNCGTGKVLLFCNPARRIEYHRARIHRRWYFLPPLWHPYCSLCFSFYSCFFLPCWINMLFIILLVLATKKLNLKLYWNIWTVLLRPGLLTDCPKM